MARLLWSEPWPGVIQTAGRKNRSGIWTDNRWNGSGDGEAGRYSCACGCSVHSAAESAKDSVRFFTISGLAARLFATVRKTEGCSVDTKLYHCSSILKIDRTKSPPTKKSQHSSSLMLGLLLGFIWVTYWHSFPWSDILDTLPFQTGAGGRWLRVLFTRYSEWNFGEHYFQENSDDFKKAQSKKQ